MSQYRVLRDVLDLALQTGAPLIVRRRCNPHQLAVWMSIRFLMDTTDREALGSREIAEEAGMASHTRVAGWIDDLITLGLLTVVGSEPIPGMHHNRPIYCIPWKKLFSDSIIEAEKSISGTKKRKRGRPPGRHELQSAMAFSVHDREQCNTVIDREQSLFTMENSTVHDRSQSTVPDREHGKEGRKEVGKEGLMRAPRKARGRPKSPPPVSATPPPEPLAPPAAPAGAPALSAHPLDLWAQACTDVRPIHAGQLATLAAEHDGATAGHGWYWVGRAILAAALTEDIRQTSKVRITLDRWRSTESYGSERSTTHAEQNNAAGRADAGRPAAPHQRHAGRSRAPRPGDRDYIKHKS